MLELFTRFGFWAFLDVSILAFIIYHLLLIFRGTRAMQMVIGLFVTVGVVFLFTQFYPLNTLKWVMDKFSASFLIILVILFQDDIRRVLSGMGKKPFFAANEPLSSKTLLDELTRAATVLAAERVGALISIERNIILNKYIEAGIIIDARVCKEILQAIFHPTSPIHDGSVIIQRGRITAAGCFLPLTRDSDVDPNFGTRHRAAIGLTQETDAVVILVSEERGAISLVVNGKVSKSLEAKELRRSLRSLLVQEKPAGSQKKKRRQADRQGGLFHWLQMLNSADRK